MKASISSFILALVLSFAAGNAAPFEHRPSLIGVHSHAIKTTPELFHKKQDATERALGIRGGGVFGTPVTKDNLACLFSLLWGIVGAVGQPAPEKAGEIWGFSLEEGTLGYFMYQIFGSNCIGLAVMAYLATKTSTSAPKISMYGALSCFYTTYCAVLKGTMAKAGFMDYFGVIQLAIFLATFYGIQTGSWDPTLAANVLTVFPLVNGLIGSIDPNTGGKLMGLPEQSKGVTNTISVWFYQTLLAWGIVSWSLLSGKSANEAIGYASLALALGVADNTFIRKANPDIGLSDSVSMIYLATSAVIAAGLLLD